MGQSRGRSDIKPSTKKMLVDFEAHHEERPLTLETCLAINAEPYDEMYTASIK